MTLPAVFSHPDDHEPRADLVDLTSPDLRVPTPWPDAESPLLSARMTGGRRSPTICVLEGELCAYTAPLLSLHLDSWAGHDVIVDLHRVDFIDAAGLTMLIGLRRRWTRRNRSLVLTSPSAAVCRLGTLLRLEEALLGALPSAWLDGDVDAREPSA